MFNNFVKTQTTIIGKLALFVMPSFLTLSTTLISCTSTVSNTNTGSDPKADPVGAKAITFKTKVLRVGYQSSGDLVRVRRVLEKRLEPLGVKVEWAQFANRKEVAKLIAPVLKIDLPIQEIISGRANYRLKGITPELMKAQQSVADLFSKEKILPKKIDVQEALLTPKEYAAITPPTLISEK